MGKEVWAQMSSIQESERMARASDISTEPPPRVSDAPMLRQLPQGSTLLLPRGGDAPLVRQLSQASVSRSGSNTPATTRVRAVSPRRNMPQAPVLLSPFG